GPRLYSAQSRSGHGSQHVLEVEGAGQRYLAAIENVIDAVIDAERFQCRFAPVRDRGGNRIIRRIDEEIAGRLALRNVLLRGHVLIKRRIVIKMFGNDIQQDGDMRTGLDFSQLMTRELVNEIRTL